MVKSLLEIKSETYHYSPLAYHDSWLMVDPIIGCRLSCQYCYMQATGWTAKIPERLYSVEEIVEKLLAHRCFVPHETVVAIGNQTDPFLPDNIDYVSEFFETLEQRGFRNPLVVVTKKRIPLEFAERACQFKNIRPVFFLSYSGLPKSVEVGVRRIENEENFRMLSGLKLRVLHFWRPLTAVNGTTEVLEAVLDLVARHSLASVYIGLKVIPDLFSVYSKNPHLTIPDSLREKRGDYIPEGVEERLRSLAASKFPDYPLYKHTSCAVSYALRIPDYNATLYQDPICKGSNCPAWKRKICEEARAVPTRHQVQELLNKLGLQNEFRVDDGFIEISEAISQEHYAYLLHRLNYPIVSTVQQTENTWGSIFRPPDQPIVSEG